MKPGKKNASLKKYMMVGKKRPDNGHKPGLRVKSDKARR